VQSTPRSPRQVACALASVAWCCRLGTFLFLRIEKDGKDGRFDSLKVHPLRFLGAWTIQALWVVLVQLPVIVVNERVDADGFAAADGVLACAWVAGFVLEALADVQKFVFNAEHHGEFINRGLWRFSRQPNYFGEILMWMSLAAAAGGRVAWLSPAFTTFLLLKVSGLPMNDARSREKWGGRADFDHYLARTSAVIPWFPAPPLGGGAPAPPAKAAGAPAAPTPVRRNPPRRAKKGD